VPSASSKTITYHLVPKLLRSSSFDADHRENRLKSLVFYSPFWVKIKCNFRSDHDRAKLSPCHHVEEFSPMPPIVLQSYSRKYWFGKHTECFAKAQHLENFEISLSFVQRQFAHPKVSVDQENGFNQKSDLPTPFGPRRPGYIHFQKVGKLRFSSTAFFCSDWNKAKSQNFFATIVDFFMA